ncbi:MAG: TM1812 family CRISPR-associated protein, partial [Thermodesulfobacteriota bacterium]|nr:TM1812 family CRISPR-associated protein [Thermodesulfobacteriota bacterium]
AADFATLAKKEINPVLKDSHGKDKAASAIRDIVTGIEKISRNILVNRGADIIKFDYENIKKPLQSLQQDDIFIKPLGPLMSVIEKKIDVFAKDDIKNGFRAVEWSVEHGLYQQAVTMLQENIVTCILAEEKMDWGLEKNRNAVSKAIKIVSEKIEEWKVDDEEERLLIEKILDNHVVVELCGAFESLRHLRNDVNHGGYITEENKMAKSSQSILDRFKKSYSEIKQKMKIYGAWK